MLTKRQNMLEVINGGNPDRFVKQYEALGIVFGTPVVSRRPKRGEMNVQDAWGVTNSWPENVISAFPVHDAEHLVVKDIENWRDYVKAPSLKFTDADWEPIIARAEAIDRNEQFVLPFVAPGLFEMCHHLCEIQNTLVYLYEYPDELAELIKYLTEYELELAENLCHYIKPDGVFHHDDWGTSLSTFFRPDMFEEFFLDSYKEIYGYYKSHGAELVVHHSDSYAATLVPYMIEMGINVWQGCLQSNDLPKLIEEYGDKITFMGGIEADIDCEGWTREMVFEHVLDICEKCGPKHYIPCYTRGLSGSLYPGVYECANEAIDEATKLFL